jgi:hypothetical protein
LAGAEALVDIRPVENADSLVVVDTVDPTHTKPSPQLHHEESTQKDE